MPFLLANWKLIVIGAIGLALAIAALWIRHLDGVIETQRNDLAACNAARAEQNAAITRAGEQTRAQQQAFSEAVAAGNQGMQQAQDRVRVVRQTVNSGCRTPPVVMGAGL